jgi:ketosteroid isomerase-like protein
MAVSHPSEINERFADGVNRGDLDTLVALFDEDARIVERDGTIAHGAAAHRVHLVSLLSVGGTMRSENRSTVIVNDLALVTAAWTITNADSSVIAAATSAEVLRRRTDGTWAYIIDHPFAGPPGVAPP